MKYLFSRIIFIVDLQSDGYIFLRNGPAKIPL